MPALQSAYAAFRQSTQRYQAIVEQKTDLETQIADSKQQLNDKSLQDVDRERIQQKLAGYSSAADAIALKMDSTKREVSRSTKNWTYVWEQFQAAEKLQKAHVKLAKDIVRNEINGLKDRAPLTAKEGRSADIQLK